MTDAEKIELLRKALVREHSRAEFWKSEMGAAADDFEFKEAKAEDHYRYNFNETMQKLEGLGDSKLPQEVASGEE